MRKNLLVIIIIILIVNSVSAQSTRLGFYGGPNVSTMFQKISGVKHTHDYVTGATVGILLDVPMQRYGSFQPGLDYIGKNSKDEYVSNGETIKTKTLLTYVEVPLNILFRIPAGGGKVTLGCGVAAAMAVSGTMSVRGNQSTNETKKLSFGDGTKDDFAKYDFGINGLAGYEFANGFFLQLNYNYGINRLIVGGDPKDKLYNRYLALRVGFLIPGKAKK